MTYPALTLPLPRLMGMRGHHPLRLSGSVYCLKISFITGGISNALYKVAPKVDTGLAPVAFR